MAVLLIFLLWAGVFIAWVASLVSAVKLRQIGWVVALILFWPCALAYAFVMPAYHEQERARLAKEMSKAREGIELRSKVKELEAEVARLAQVVSKA
jgi:hypothetical protein